jgi:hypothetical protein
MSCINDSIITFFRRMVKNLQKDLRVARRKHTRYINGCISKQKGINVARKLFAINQELKFLNFLATCKSRNRINVKHTMRFFDMKHFLICSLRCTSA